MCFYNSMSVNTEELATRYKRKTDILEIAQAILDEQGEGQTIDKRFLIPAYDDVHSPIITLSSSIQSMSWGLIPNWLQPKNNSEEELERVLKMEKKCKMSTINARSETIFNLPSYKESIRKRRCLIPSTGYFEYRHEGRKTSPYFIYLKNEEIFSMAGIFDEWIHPVSGKTLLTFSQITVPGNEFTNTIHNGGKNPFRMPALLQKNEEEIWLNPHLTEKEIKELLKSFEASEMGAHPVTEDFRKLDPHNPKIAEQI